MTKRILLSLVALAACLSIPLLADDPDGQYEPGRAVARISILNGDVSVRRGDTGDVVAAAVNGPLVADDRLLTTSSSRAEVQLDHNNVIRIGPNSEVRFVGLDRSSFQLQIAAGTVTFREVRPGGAQVELETPSVSVHPAQPGVYRIAVQDDSSSEITVRVGEAEIFSQRGSERLAAGRTMHARGPAQDPEFQVVAAIPMDNWDRWSEDRDHYLERSQSYRYVSPDVYGAEDLDQNGRWLNDPNYGEVWSPNVAPGWAPYSDGRWVWEDYYGWTWVSNDPWGWAPYHYGRWYYGPAGWCWYPGSIFAPHFWAPAFVGFFGWGGGVGFGFGFGGVGWVPLAPFEAFHPWWGRGFYGGFRNNVFNNTTIVNNTNIASAYRNARVNGAVMGVNTANFGRGGQFTRLNSTQIQQAGLVHGVLPVSPDRSSLRMSDRNPTGNLPQGRATSFASHMPATRADHVPFEQQQRGIEQMSHSNLNSAARGAGNSTAPGAGSASGGSGWQRSGDRPPNASSGPAAAGAATNSASASHGWGRFGEAIHGTSPGSAAGSSGSLSSNAGWQRFDSPRLQGSAPVRISPPMVRERGPGYAPSYQAPRSSAPSTAAPRSSAGAARSSGGGHSSGGHGGGHK